METTLKPDVKLPDPTTEEGDHDRFSHIVYPAEAVTEALINGTPVRALCGKIWVPSRDPKRYPLCEMCKEIREAAGGNMDIFKETHG